MYCSAVKYWAYGKERKQFCADPEFSTTCPRTCRVCPDQTRRRRKAKAIDSDRVRGEKEVNDDLKDLDGENNDRGRRPRRRLRVVLPEPELPES